MRSAGRIESVGAPGAARRRRWLLVGGFAAGLGLATVVMVLDVRVRAYLAGPPLGGARIYAAPSTLRVGRPVAGGSLGRTLGRLGYRRVSDGQRPLAAGEFRVQGPTFEVALRPSPVPGAESPHRVRVTLGGSRVLALQDREGRSLARVDLDPELLAVLGSTGPALGADAEDAPAACRAAVLAAEDRKFFHHPGLDPLAIARALLADLHAGSARQGGSTLTQQLVKNAFLSPHRTVWRKLVEAGLALLLDLRATKEEILARYLSSVYLGTDSGLPVHGFAQAATVYFGTPLADLGPAECALLAGIIRSPNALSPRRHPEAALARRNHVLAAMAEARQLDPVLATQAAATPLVLAPPTVRPVAALYVATEVARELPRIVDADVAEAPGLSIFTAIDADTQRAAERALRRGLAALERRRHEREPLQAALVALDPGTGRIRAVVGGRDYRSSPLDRVMLAQRQPGSAFKPFVYLAALDPARRGTAAPRTVVSPVDDAPLAVRVGTTVWRPVNSNHRFAGTIPLETALAESRNTATVRLALDVGIDAVARTAAELGISSPLPRVPALALGAAETSLLEVTAAYGVFAGGGLRRPPGLVVAVTSATGEVLYTAATTAERVVDPDVAYLITHLLQGVIDTETGTGHAARAAGLTGAAAGKTGTTNDTRDAWFIGFTPAILAGVWVGLDSGGPTGLTGARGALPIWTDFVRAVAGADGPREFPVPDGIAWRDVDPASGGLATATCPEVRREPFLAGTEPHEPCPLHRPVWTAFGRVRDWLARLFH